MKATMILFLNKNRKTVALKAFIDSYHTIKIAKFQVKPVIYPDIFI